MRISSHCAFVRRVARESEPHDNETLPSCIMATAMGFLTVGRRFLGVTHDIIDDRIDVVMRGTQALTVGCSRCHDHKDDPIPTRDYYALYGVFQNCAEELVRLAPDSPAADRSDFEKELDKRVQKLEQTLLAKRAEASDRVRQRVDEYLLAQLNPSDFSAYSINC